MTPDPDTWPLAETWEECARHVEDGGVVQVSDYRSGDGWRDECLFATSYRGSNGTPGKDGNFPRRLLPIEAPIEASMTPDVPEGCEIVYIPTETIDYLHGSWCGTVYDDGPWYRLSLAICDTVARRPDEKVHWSDAVGRRDMNGDLITKVTKEDVDQPQVLYYSNNEWHPASDDGLIDVLVEDGES